MTDEVVETDNGLRPDDPAQEIDGIPVDELTAEDVAAIAEVDPYA